MLKIRRSRPSSFYFDQIETARDRLLQWARRSTEERRQRRAPIDHDLFHSSHIVDMVTEEFQGRCVYCEREIGSKEGVSHYRPLTLNGDERTSEFEDHYSWLAFEWLNLFLICRHCKRARAEQFPIIGHRARFLATIDDVRGEEKPLLIDPTRDNPSRHLYYLITGECFPKSESAKGNATVNFFKLNDERLVGQRREAINEALRSWRLALNESVELPRDFLQSGAFVGACRSVLSRTLSEYGEADIPIQSGSYFLRRLQSLIIESDREEADRLIGAVLLLENSDIVRSSELSRRRPFTDYTKQPSQYPLQTAASPIANGELEWLHVSNFRAIDKVHIPFSRVRSKRSGAPCMLLLGENAVGKSTCLAAMALALLGTREANRLGLKYKELARSEERESWDVWGKKPLEISVKFQDEDALAYFRYDPFRNKIDGTREQSAIVLGYGPHRYFGGGRKRRGSGAAQGVRSLFDSRHPIPDPSNWLTELRGREFDEVARTIRTILPIGDGDDLVHDKRAGICILAQGQLTPVVQLSEGYRSVFAMVADMSRELLNHWSNLEQAQGVVMIDELETHLHPRWKMRVMSSLRTAFPRVQFIATTHDPLCVRGMDDGEVAVLARDDVGRVNLLEDLPAISGMRAEQLLTSEFFGLSSTIDPKVQLEIAHLADGSKTDTRLLLGNEATDLISKITVGDSAAAQIIHEALLLYLRERTQPDLSSNARQDAVQEVFQALRAAKERW